MEIGKITLGTIWDKHPSAVNVYIGRAAKNNTSPLGNPFPITADQDRDTVCDKYEEYLMEKMNQGDAKILKELNRIGELLLQGQDVHLQCFCKNKRCHGSFIIEVLEDALAHKVFD